MTKTSAELTQKAAGYMLAAANAAKREKTGKNKQTTITTTTTTTVKKTIKKTINKK